MKIMDLPAGAIILMLGATTPPDGWVDGLKYNDQTKNYCHSIFFKLIGMGYQNDFKCIVKVK